MRTRTSILLVFVSALCGCSSESSAPAPASPGRRSSAVSCPVDVSVGGDHACALRDDGSVVCWGRVRSGSFASAEPVGVVSPKRLESPAPFAAIAAGDSVTCAVTRDGRLSCVGSNRVGTLGAPEVSDHTAAWVPVPGAGSGIKALSLGWWSACSADASGLSCWGESSTGIGGNVSPIVRAPSRIALTSPVRSLGVGTTHACAVTEDGRVRCWGNNARGQLGDGTVKSSAAPVEVLTLVDAVGVTTGGSHTCATRSSGTVSCWGDGRDGRLGTAIRAANAPKIDQRVLQNEIATKPMAVPGLGDVRAVHAGDGFTCALGKDGGVRCWGSNGRGELGDGSATSSLRAVPVLSLASVVRALSAAGGTACAVTDACGVYCWGDGTKGQLGDPALRLSRVPRRVVLP